MDEPESHLASRARGAPMTDAAERFEPLEVIDRATAELMYRVRKAWEAEQRLMQAMSELRSGEYMDLVSDLSKARQAVADWLEIPSVDALMISALRGVR